MSAAPEATGQEPSTFDGIAVEEWEAAEQAHRAYEDSGVPVADRDPVVQAVAESLGALVGIWQGYGEAA